MKQEKIFNLPNLISFYRLLTFPFILWMVYAGEEKMFAIFLCINLITDILDGLIARLFKLQTKFGAKLDSLADTGMYILAFLGIYFFKLEELQGFTWMLWLFLALLVSGNLISLIKFKKLPSLHLYSSKVGGYVQGIFFFVLFAWSYNQSLFFAAMFIGYLSLLEEIFVLLFLKKLIPDARGLFWVLNEKKE
ncbi:MAG: CDP-alcohol phosphatidyltransferase family protein [Bacteroidota bacterium]